MYFNNLIEMQIFPFNQSISYLQNELLMAQNRWQTTILSDLAI